MRILQGVWLCGSQWDICTAQCGAWGFSRAESPCVPDEREPSSDPETMKAIITPCYVQTNKPSSKLEPVSTGLMQLCHVHTSFIPCPAGVASKWRGFGLPVHALPFLGNAQNPGRLSMEQRLSKPICMLCSI